MPGPPRSTRSSRTLGLGIRELASLPCAAALLAIVACRGGAINLAGQTHVYRCADGYRFVVRFEPQRAWLFAGDGARSAPQVPARAGLHYSTGPLVFTSDGERATLRMDGAEHTGCVRQPFEAEWEEARLRGVELRATGDDAEWTLEVSASTAMFRRGGTTRGVPPGSWRATPGCPDARRSELLPLAVEVSLDGRTYRGCGRRF